MEQTLGKRIQLCRKSLGLTQDQLAEKLGVTAQAVSKWENDQSCPDITMLPKLAETFGTTTDALLGRQAEKVHEATIENSKDEDTANGIHVHKGNWQFHYDYSRRGGILFALLVLTVGVLTLLSNILQWDVSFWSILWPTVLLVFGLQGLYPKFSFFSIGCTLFGGYFLLDNLHVIQLDLGNLVWPIIVILFGLSLLADAIRKPKKPLVEFIRNGKADRTPVTDFNIDDDSFNIEVSFSNAKYPVDLPMLNSGDISCNFGELVVDLCGCEAVSTDCYIDAECNFGELTLLIPGRFCVELDRSNAFGSVDISGQPDPNAEGTIHLDASANFGHINIQYI